jgi:hypothetical protein
MTVRPFVGASTTTVVASTANGRMVIDGQLTDALLSHSAQQLLALYLQLVMPTIWYLTQVAQLSDT